MPIRQTLHTADGNFHSDWYSEEEYQSIEAQLTEAHAEVIMLKAEKRFVCDPRPNLLHLGWAQGDYSNKCHHCETVFTGDKRAWCCADCAWKMESERAEKAEADAKGFEVGQNTEFLRAEKAKAQVETLKLRFANYDELRQTMLDVAEENKRLLATIQWIADSGINGKHYQSHSSLVKLAQQALKEGGEVNE